MGRKTRKGLAALKAISSALGNTSEPETVTQNLETGAAASETPVSEAVIEDVVEALAATEGTETAAPIEPVVAASANDFDQAIAAVSEEQVDAKIAATVEALNERRDFELVKDATNKKIQTTLNKAQARLCTKSAARVLCVTNVDPVMINRTIHEGARYNVYALGKMADVVNSLSDGKAVRNAINLACMKSLFHFRASGVPFTGEMAKASASDKIKVDSAVRDMLVRHTVSASTAPTQASSTMQALETLGIVSRSGSARNPTFTPTVNPITAKVEALLAA